MRSLFGFWEALALMSLALFVRYPLRCVFTLLALGFLIGFIARSV